jgi:hypothetical protein
MHLKKLLSFVTKHQVSKPKTNPKPEVAVNQSSQGFYNLARKHARTLEFDSCYIALINALCADSHNYKAWAYLAYSLPANQKGIQVGQRFLTKENLYKRALAINPQYEFARKHLKNSQSA